MDNKKNIITAHYKHRLQEEYDPGLCLATSRCHQQTDSEPHDLYFSIKTQEEDKLHNDTTGQNLSTPFTHMGERNIHKEQQEKKAVASYITDRNQKSLRVFSECLNTNSEFCNTTSEITNTCIQCMYQMCQTECIRTALHQICHFKTQFFANL